MLAGEILRRAAGRFPDKTALIEGERRMSFAEFDRAADRAAAALASLGLVPGARIAILAPNLLEYPIVHFAAARAGLILAHFSTRATAADLARLIDLSGAEALVFWGELGEIVAAGRALARTGSLRHLIAIGPSDMAGAIAFEMFLERGLERGLDRARGALTAPALAPDHPLAMGFTGGTTGQPKGVLVSHRARYATAVTVAVEFGLDERDVALVVTPLFHAAGMFVWFQPAIMLGCTCVLQRRWDVDEFMTLVGRHLASASLLVPTQLGDLSRHPDFSAARLGSLRHIHYAGAPMPLALYDRLAASLPDVAFTENYGQTETGPMTVRRPFHPHDKRGSVGRPAHNVELRVVGPDGAELARGALGEIVTRGEHVMSEYWGDPEETRARFRLGDGWLWTGDLGVHDADGFFTLVDRATDMIISGAENIYPAEIENALFRHEAVAECAVFGVPDERWGEAPAAHVVLRPGLSASAEDLIDFLGRTLARYKRPRLIKFVEHLPKTAVGKIQKNVLREPYWRGRDRRI